MVFFGGSGESDLEGDRCWPPCWQKHIFSGQTGHNESETHHTVHTGQFFHQALSSISLGNEENMVPVLEALSLMEVNRLNNQCDEV